MSTRVSSSAQQKNQVFAQKNASYYDGVQHCRCAYSSCAGTFHELTIRPTGMGKYERPIAAPPNGIRCRLAVYTRDYNWRHFAQSTGSCSYFSRLAFRSFCRYPPRNPAPTLHVTTGARLQLFDLLAKLTCRSASPLASSSAFAKDASLRRPVTTWVSRSTSFSRCGFKARTRNAGSTTVVTVGVLPFTFQLYNESRHVTATFHTWCQRVVVNEI